MAWLSGWGRRKKQTITGTTAGAQTNYQKKMIVHKGSGSDSSTDVYCGGNCRDDFGDIRWTKDDGTTPMDYWIESIESGVKAVFWVEIPSIPTGAGTVDVYMYYDKSDATSISSGGNTFDFFDDFPGSSLDTDKWDVGLGTPTVNNSLFLDDGEWIETKTWTGNTTRIRFKLISPNEYGSTTYQVCGLYDMSANKGGGATNTYYNWDFYTNDGTVEYTTITSFDGTHIFEILKVAGTSSKIYIDGNLETTHTAHVPNVEICYHLRKVGGNDLEVDWVFASKYADPEPTWGTWGGEETPVYYKYVSDSGTGVDVLSTLSANIPAPDSGVGADILGALFATVPASDSGVGFDAVMAFIFKLISDSGVGADSVGIGAIIPVSDLGTGVDVASLLAEIFASDSGAGIEVPVVVIPFSDSGIGVDLPSVSASVPISDSGVGTDTKLIQALISALDSGVGADVISIMAQIASLDSGLGADVLSTLAANIPISDSGVGADAWLREVLVGYVMIGNVVLDAVARVNRWEGSRDECDLDITLFGDPATIKQKEAELTEQAKYAGQLDVIEPPYAARIWQDRSPGGKNRIFVILHELGVYAYFLQREFSSEATTPTIRRIRFRLVKV